MNERIFDAITRHAAAPISRRGITHALAGLVLGGAWASLLSIGNAEAKKKGKRKKRRTCKGNKKKCGKKCISKSDCCVECSGGKTCQDGKCACPSGEYDCQGTCIPEGECCTAADCDSGEICVQGQCVTGQGTCQAGQDVCIDITDECGGGDCYCYTSMSNETRCGFKLSLTDCLACSSDTECAAFFPDIPGVFCVLDTGENCVCGGVCYAPCLS
jgi:hypothetical protein